MKPRPLSNLLFVLALTAISAFTASAQPLHQSAIRQQLEHKVLLFRGRYVCPTPKPCTLVFNQQGQLKSRAKVAPFSLSAVYVDGLGFGENALTIEAYEATFMRLSSVPPYTFRAVTLKDSQLLIRIPLNYSKPSELRSTLRTIFTGGIQNALKAEPTKQRETDLATLPLLTKEKKNRASQELKQVIWPAVHNLKITRKQGISPPKPIYTPEPQYTELAQHENVHGICKLMFIVNDQGLPQNIRIIRSLSDGLNERAIAALSQYRFRPSMANGKPVPVRVIVDIDFHLH